MEIVEVESKVINKNEEKKVVRLGKWELYLRKAAVDEKKEKPVKTKKGIFGKIVKFVVGSLVVIGGVTYVVVKAFAKGGSSTDVDYEIPDEKSDDVMDPNNSDEHIDYFVTIDGEE